MLPGLIDTIAKASIFGLGGFGSGMPNWLIMMISFILACLIAAVSIPAIIEVSRIKGLFDAPNSRKLHSGVVPALGGAAVLLGMIMDHLIKLWSSMEIMHKS